MERNVVFLFGAGAENVFGLPNGSDYTRETMLRKRELMYNALAGFYKDRLGKKDYVSRYQRDFLFRRGSHTFNEIVYGAAKKYIDVHKTIKAETIYDKVDAVESYIDAVKRTNGNDSDDVKEKAKNLYDYLIKDSDQWKDYSATHDHEPEFLNYLKYCGAVEKDFATITDPEELGMTRFWRVINYFWSAFFTIIEPLLSEKYSSVKENSGREVFYSLVLEDINEAIKDIYDNDRFVSKFSSAFGNYYREISKSFTECDVLTTNYTPFVEFYFDPERCTYLAGKLSQFEYPMELSVYDVLLNKKIESNDFVFPFLMTQAPIKPIIVPEQIEAYAKAITALDKAKTLVIIGYSLGAADNHINAMLHRFAKTESKRIIYCYYVDKTKPNDPNKEAEEKRKVIEALKCENCSAEIKMVRNEGNAKELTAKIKEVLQYGSN